MRITTTLAWLTAGVLTAGAAVMAPGPVAAAPLGKPAAEGDSVVHQTQAYRRSCTWVNGGWNYRRGKGYVACRPYRPAGRGWIWHNEGPRVGWYLPSRKEWHWKKW